MSTRSNEDDDSSKGAEKLHNKTGPDSESVINKIVFTLVAVCAVFIISVSIWKIHTQDLVSKRILGSVNCENQDISNSLVNSAYYGTQIKHICDEKYCYCAKQTRTSICSDDGHLNEKVLIEPFLMSIERREKSKLNITCKGITPLSKSVSGICLKRRNELLVKSAKIINTQIDRVVDKILTNSTGTRILDHQIELASSVSVKCDKNGLFSQIQPGDPEGEG